MNFEIIRVEKTKNSEGQDEVFVQINYTDETNGTIIPYAKWLSQSEQERFLNDENILGSLVESWSTQALELYNETHTSVSSISVTMRQARLALLGAGLLDQIDAAVTAAGPAARIEWEYAQTVDRDWPLVNQLVAGLGMSTEQIDVLFEAAKNL